MDEIAVPISWFRPAEEPESLSDAVCTRGSEVTTSDPALDNSKASPAVAVYLLQFYPVTQACVQPCVSADGQLANNPALPPVSLSQQSSEGPCFASPSPQTCSRIQNVHSREIESKATTVKLEPICLLTEQQDLKQQSSNYQSNIEPPPKWKQADSGEQPVTVISRVANDNSVHLTPAKHTNQISAGTLSVSSVRTTNSMNPVEPVRSVEHNVRTQPGEKPYSCNLCGKVFARAHNLKAHSQTHSGALPFACKICRKSYSQGAYYRIHSEILSGGRPYTCDVCSKVFCNSRSFNFHIRSHSRRKIIA